MFLSILTQINLPIHTEYFVIHFLYTPLLHQKKIYRILLIHFIFRLQMVAELGGCNYWMKSHTQGHWCNFLKWKGCFPLLNRNTLVEKWSILMQFQNAEWHFCGGWTPWRYSWFVDVFILVDHSIELFLAFVVSGCIRCLFTAGIL